VICKLKYIDDILQLGFLGKHNPKYKSKRHQFQEEHKEKAFVPKLKKTKKLKTAVRVSEN
jgi:hypothetical protein